MSAELACPLNHLFECFHACGNVALSFLSTRGIQIPTHPCTASYPFFVTLAKWCRQWYRLSFRSRYCRTNSSQSGSSDLADILISNGPRLCTKALKSILQSWTSRTLLTGFGMMIYNTTILVSPQPLYLWMHLSPRAMFWDLVISIQRKALCVIGENEQQTRLERNIPSQYHRREEAAYICNLQDAHYLMATRPEEDASQSYMTRSATRISHVMPRHTREPVSRTYSTGKNFTHASRNRLQAVALEKSVTLVASPSDPVLTMICIQNYDL